MDKIIIDANKIMRIYTSASLRNHGDEHEQKWSSFLTQRLPSYELIWKCFVLPFRASKETVQLSLDLTRSHEALCIYNYSIMRTATRLEVIRELAKKSKDAEDDTTSDLFNDFFIWLVIGYEQMYQFLAAFYCSVILGEGGDNIEIRDWKNPNVFGASSKEWYLKNVSKSLAMKIKASNEQVRLYRNNIVHGPKWPGWKDQIPNPNEIDHQIYWSDWVRESEREDFSDRLIDRYVAMQSSFDNYFSELNEFYQRLLDYTIEKSISIPDSDHILLNAAIDSFSNMDVVGTSGGTHSVIFKLIDGKHTYEA